MLTTLGAEPKTVFFLFFYVHIRLSCNSDCSEYRRYMKGMNSRGTANQSKMNRSFEVYKSDFWWPILFRTVKSSSPPRAVRILRGRLLFCHRRSRDWEDVGFDFAHFVWVVLVLKVINAFKNNKQKKTMKRYSNDLPGDWLKRFSQINM